MDYKRWTIIVSVLGSGVVFLDSTVVSIALPRIGQDLPSTWLGVLEGQSYVYTGYLLSLSALLILAGALSDYYGRRRTFMIGLALFGATSVVCGLAPTMEALIVFRILQGAAGALLVPGSLALLRATFSGEEQGRAFGIWAGASAATTILGPPVGGLLVDTVSWRAAFLINLPLVLIGLWGCWKYVHESRNEQASSSFHWFGAVVVALAVGGLAFGAIYGQQREWQDPLAFVLLAVGAFATLGLPFIMARAANPLIPLDLFKSRNFTVTNLSTLVIYGALYVSGAYGPLYLQGTLGYTAAGAGMAAIPSTLLLVLYSPRFGALAGRYGPRWFMAAGPALMGLGSLWFTRLPETSTAWQLRLDVPASWIPPVDYAVDLLPGYLVFGMGLTVMVAPLTTALMTSVPERVSGTASAINNAISRIGPQLASAVIFVAITASFYQSLSALAPELDVSQSAVREQISPLNRPAEGTSASNVAAARTASTDAFHLSMAAVAALCFLGAAINAAGIRPLPTPDPSVPPSTSDALKSAA